MKTLVFRMPLFPSRIKVFFGLDLYCKTYNETKSELDKYGAFVSVKGEDICMVFNDNCYSEGLLAHESVHAAWNVLDNACVKVTFDNDEPLAYCTQYIFERVQSHYNKEKSKLLAIS
jgi:hypothetical protein